MNVITVRGDPVSCSKDNNMIYKRTHAQLVYQALLYEGNYRQMKYSIGVPGKYGH